MISPIENVKVLCPKCDQHDEDWWRPSVNLDLDDFDDEYLEQCSSAVCPHCRHEVHFQNLAEEYSRDSDRARVVGDRGLDHCWHHRNDWPF